jgi:hypothetical protein
LVEQFVKDKYEEEDSEEIEYLYTITTTIYTYELATGNYDNN